MPQNSTPKPDVAEDPKVAADWAAVESRRAELNSREGGDNRRRAILRRLGMLKEAS